METWQVPVTAQRVAAHRLTFDRVAAPHGDPATDERLARDVAAGVAVKPGPMRDYLRARTRFFDRVVTRLRGCGWGQPWGQAARTARAAPSAAPV